MKKILSSLLLIAIAAMALSCNKEQLKNNDVHESGNASVFHIFASTSETKSVFGTKEDGAYPTLWTVNKNVAFSRDEAKFVEGAPILPEGEDAARTATFDVELPGETESGTIYAFSPMGLFNRESPSNNVPGFTSINAKYQDAYLIIPAEQTPLANSVDESAQAIFGKVDYSAGKYNLNMSFNHVVAYGKMSITNFAGGAIKSVAITFPEDIVGSNCYYYYAGEKVGTISNMDGKTIILDPKNVVDNTFWFALAPTAGNKGEMKIIITDNNDDTYTKTIDLTKKALPFEIGKVSSFSANFSGIAKDVKDAVYTWDLTKASYSSATDDLVTWTSPVATMTNARNGSSNTKANNYLGGTNDHTRTYNGNILTIAPGTGCEITKVVITASTAGYANPINRDWSNATVNQNNNQLTITPEYGTQSFSVTSTGTTRLTSVQVYYVAAATKALTSIALSGTYPTEFNTGDEFSHEGMTVTATYDDATTADVTSNATFSGYDMDTPGQQAVTVSYTEVETTKSAQYTITITATPMILADDITDVPAIGGDFEHTYTAKYFITDDVEVAAVDGVDGKVVTEAIVEDGGILFTVAPNYTTTAKNGTITLQSASNSDITKIINVSQLKSNLSVSDTEVVIPYNALETTFAITSKEMSWNASVSAAEGMNLTVDKMSGEKADVKQTVTVSSTVEASDSESLTLGTITIYRNGNISDSQKKTITVRKEKVPAPGAVYTLNTSDPSTKGDNNSYAGNCDVTVDGITWNVTGNATMNPWRIGGKSLSNIDRAVYTKTPYDKALSKIVLTIGNASNISVNSLKLVYSTNSDFSGAKTLGASQINTNDENIFEPEGGFPEKCYYKFILNVSVTGTSNKFVEFSKVCFY